MQYYRFAKSEIWAHEKEKQAADLARERHEFRELRLDREKQERAAKLAQKAASAKAAPATPQEADASAAKKAVIQAAMERAKAQRTSVQPQNVDNLPPDKLREIEEIEARRAKMRETLEHQQK